MTDAAPFGERVRAALDRYGPLCVGIDPHTGLLAAWGLDASAAGAREFGLRVVEASAGGSGSSSRRCRSSSATAPPDSPRSRTC